jgi:hypothetical protein
MDGVTYNGVCVIRNQQILGITLKQNLADEGVHYEPRWFRAWKAGEVTSVIIGGQEVAVGDLIYTHRDITFGFEICEDAWRKNRPGYRLKERGVQLILNPSASHFALGKSTHREKDVVIDGSEKFQCVYLFVNHLGNEAGRMIYDGDIVVGQNGKLIAVNERLSFKPFVVMTCRVDVTDASNTKVIPITDNRERNEEFARAVSLALFDYLRKSKSRGFVLSLSGGADSACCAVLVAEMVRRASATLGWPAYSGSQARRWGAPPGPPKEFVEVGKIHLVRSAAKINSWDELVTAICNGYPCTVASSQGFNMEPSRDGFHAPSGSWAHQMCIVGVDGEASDPYAVILNSWGDAHGRLKDFVSNEDMPIGVLRVRKRTIERMIAAGETFAFSNFEGFPEQPIAKELFKLI